MHPNETHEPLPSNAASPPPRRAYLRPQYVEQFRCIGSACEDTCCQGWSVPIDQATYEKYATIETMKPHLGTIIVRNPEGAKRSDFARINTTSTYPCFFLDEERLCTIQKQLGPSLLSTTCANYPRSIATNSGMEERSLSLSCPEAARLTLLHGNLLGIPQPDTPRHTTGPERYAAIFQEIQRFQQQAERRADNLPSPIDPVPYDPFLAIREFALLLLTDRSYPIWQRLLLLGTVVGQLHTLSEGGSEAAYASEHPAIVAQLLSEGASVVSQDKLRAVMDAVELQPAEQLPLILDLLRQRIAQPPISPRFLECLQDFETGLETATATSEAQILSTYTDAYRNYVRPLLERHPHLVENYLANYVFRNNYPFGKPSDQALSEGAEDRTDAGNEHMLLCVQLALLQTVLVGMAARHREAFDCAHVVKLVQSLAKSVEHSKPFLRQITDFVAKRNLNNLRGIAFLLKPND
jgi:lysine-N-methylase